MVNNNQPNKKPYTPPNIMDINPESLAQQQEAYLANGAATILEEIASLIRKRDYKEVSKRYSYSPAGDEAGCENHYIHFTSLHPTLEDIEQVVTRLIALKHIQEEQERQWAAEEAAAEAAETARYAQRHGRGVVPPPAIPAAKGRS